MKDERSGGSGETLTREASTALVDAYKTLRKRWVWFVTLTCAVVVGAAFYTAGQRRIYRSSCVLQIDPTPPKPLGQDIQAVVDVGSSTYWANAEYYKTQFEIIRSRSVTEETVRRLRLHRDAGFALGLAPNEKPTEAESSAETTVEQAAQQLRGLLSVEPIKESRLVKVSFQDADPKRARQILSTLVSVYVDRNIDVALDSTNNAAEWLHGQVDKLKRELEGSEIALHEYRRDQRILSISLEDQLNMLRQEMQQLSGALTSVRVRRAQVAARAKELAGVGASDTELDLSNSELLRDGTLQQLRTTLAQAVAERDSLRGEGKAEMHPLMASARARVSAAQAALEAAADAMRRAAQRELSVVDSEIENLSALSEQAHRRALELGRLEIDYRRLERSKKNTEKLYSLVIERSKESDLTRMMRFNNIQTIDPPTVPRAPVSPRVPFNMALGLAGGIALGLFGAFAREMFDRSVKSPADIEQELGMTFLGLVPRFSVGAPTASYGAKRRRRRSRDEPDQHPELIVHSDPSSAASEAARAIRTNISFMSPDRPFRTILVTSAAPSEGKTTVACCIATAMAQAGHRVVLVDADLRRPRVHRIFDQANDRGVTTTLLERCDLAEVVQETPVPNLSILLSGPACPNPAETLQSESFQRLLRELSERFDRVVIDSPPVGPVTDAVVLSTRADATVMVVRALASARETVRDARRTLEDVRGNLIGAVLNAADPSRRGYPEYYRYYGPRDPETDEAKAS